MLNKVTDTKLQVYEVQDSVSNFSLTNSKSLKLTGENNNFNEANSKTINNIKKTSDLTNINIKTCRCIIK